MAPANRRHIFVARLHAPLVFLRCLLLPAACCLLPVDCCLLTAACCLLPAGFCQLFAVSCLLRAACSLFSVALPCYFSVTLPDTRGLPGRNVSFLRDVYLKYLRKRDSSRAHPASSPRAHRPVWRVAAALARGIAGPRRVGNSEAPQTYTHLVVVVVPFFLRTRSRAD